MNYRHMYHAGNFADVFKHILLIGLIQSLLKKDKPFCYLDTHAGIGCYDLKAAAAQKTQEFKDGVFKLWELDIKALPELIACYVQKVKEWNAKQGALQLHYYPGSPILVREFLRKDDHMMLTELHPQDVLLLKKQFINDKQVVIHHLDGYQAFKALLPPKESRGLVFIDPPFEKTDEFTQIITQLKLVVHRWRAATYAVWYPIKNRAEIERFYQELQDTGIRKILCCEISLPHLTNVGLSACGMIVVNPPWQWQEKISAVLSAICEILSAPLQGSSRMMWLVLE